MTREPDGGRRPPRERFARGELTGEQLDEAKRRLGVSGGGR
jgi:hypothetical protein